MQHRLKLVTQYDAQHNEYTVHRHNLTSAEATDALQQLAGRLFSLFVVEQHGIHSADNPEECRDCRRDVERSSQLQPKPTLKRRKS